MYVFRIQTILSCNLVDVYCLELPLFSSVYTWYFDKNKQSLLPYVSFNSYNTFFLAILSGGTASCFDYNAQNKPELTEDCQWSYDSNIVDISGQQDRKTELTNNGVTMTICVLRVVPIFWYCCIHVRSATIFCIYFD